MTNKYLDAFTRFNMDHLSSQSINLYLANPAMFILQYAHGYRGPTNAAMLRGTTTDKMIGQAGMEPSISLGQLEKQADDYVTAALEDVKTETENSKKELERIKTYINDSVTFYRRLGKTG